MIEGFSVDEVDFKIIDILKQDARISFSKIAQKLGVGTDSVIRRYKKLLKTGIISKPTIVLNSRMCGFQGIVDFYIKIQSGTDVNDVIAQLGKIKNVNKISRTLGDIDLLCNAFFSDFEDLVKLTRSVKAIDHLLSVEVSVYVGPDWLIPLDFEVGHTHI